MTGALRESTIESRSGIFAAVTTAIASIDPNQPKQGSRLQLDEVQRVNVQDVDQLSTSLNAIVKVTEKKTSESSSRSPRRGVLVKESSSRSPRRGVPDEEFQKKKLREKILKLNEEISETTKKLDHHPRSLRQDELPSNHPAKDKKFTNLWETLRVHMVELIDTTEKLFQYCKNDEDRHETLKNTFGTINRIWNHGLVEPPEFIKYETYKYLLKASISGSEEMLLDVNRLKKNLEGRSVVGRSKKDDFERDYPHINFELLKAK